MAHYLYHPVGHNQLRLIKFTQNEEKEISAVIETFSLEEPLPTFYALSYTWSSVETELGKTWKIQIDNRTLSVLDTLRPFVLNLACKGMLDDGHWWWIDSMCIDQVNLEEKSQQVQLMQNMYLKAVQVIVWLGKESDDSGLAMDFIEFLDHTMQQECTDDEYRSKLQIDEYRPHWVALTNFFARQWWTRIWTIQECVIPSTVSFWCGMRDVSRVAIGRSISAADRCSSTGIKETIAFRYGLNRKRVWNLFEEATRREKMGVASLQRPILSLVAYFCCMDVTNDRDRLYGLRALATDGDLLDVDYVLSIQQVYLRFVQAFIDRHKSLDIICFAPAHSEPEPSSDTAGQPSPSWVPTWRRKGAFLSMPVMVSQTSSTHIGNMRPARFLEYDPSIYYSASGNRKAVYEFQDLTLIAQGAIFDEIDGLAGSRYSEMIQSSSACNATTEQQLGCRSDSTHDHSPISVLKSICKSLVLDRHDRFLRYHMPVDEFFRDFLSLCASIATTTEPQSRSVAEEFQEWYHGAKSLRIHGQSFESALGEGLRLDPCNGFTGSAPNQNELVDSTFFGRFFDVVMRMSMRLMVSRDGRIGMAPEKAINGDLVCILYGCSVPVVLRRKAEDDGFLFVGECFVDGCMDGSVLEQKNILETTFMIR